MFYIVEKYITIAGESPITGEPVFLIRFTDCNLDCIYCDTVYKNEINVILSINDLKVEITREMDKYPGLKILLTGGEPLLGERQKDIINLIRELPSVNFYIETNGSIRIANFSLNNTFYILDWKSPRSQGTDKIKNDIFYRDNLKKLRNNKDVIKFIVNKEDLIWLKEKVAEINKINPTVKIYISPRWNETDFKEIVSFIIDNKLPVNFSLQIHKIIWPDKERGV